MENDKLSEILKERPKHEECQECQNFMRRFITYIQEERTSQDLERIIRVTSEDPSNDVGDGSG